MIYLWVFMGVLLGKPPFFVLTRRLIGVGCGLGSRGYRLRLLLNLLLARRAVRVLRVLVLLMCDMGMLASFKDYTNGLFELGC